MKINTPVALVPSVTALLMMFGLSVAEIYIERPPKGPLLQGCAAAMVVINGHKLPFWIDKNNRKPQVICFWNDGSMTWRYAR